MRTMPPDTLRGRPDVIAWFADHGLDAHTIAARQHVDDIAVLDDGSMRFRRYLVDAGGGRQLLPGGDVAVEDVHVTPTRPFPEP